MDRADKDLNRAFYDTEREDDRRRFDEQPSKVFLTETLVPWVVSLRRAGSADRRHRRRERRLRLADRAGGAGHGGRARHQRVDGAAAGEDPLLPRERRRRHGGAAVRGRELRRGALRRLPPPRARSAAGAARGASRAAPGRAAVRGRARARCGSGRDAASRRSRATRTSSGSRCATSPAGSATPGSGRRGAGQATDAPLRAARPALAGHLGASAPADRIDRVLDAHPGLSRGSAELALVHAHRA